MGPDPRDLNGQEFAQAMVSQIDEACVAARRDFRAYSSVARADRARFLRTIAEQIDVLGEKITKTAMAETGLPEARLNGERGRTTGQLEMFAELIESDDYLDLRKDKALPERQPIPRPDIRLTHKPIGPVAVFGASNFPLAFSTAGGDTASALAAGCPVVVKGHGAHPGTAELVAQAIARAIEICDMPKAAFQMVQGSGHDVGTALVQHPEIAAVGFTGSLRGGRALFDLCQSRPSPIPFFGELGSINPVFCLPAALAAQAADIGAGWASSLTLGAGQFCTNPGVAVVLAREDAEKEDVETFVHATKSALEITAEQKMLTGPVLDAYHKGVSAFSEKMETVFESDTSCSEGASLPALFSVTAKNWMQDRELQHEVFGAVGIVVQCNSTDEMIDLAEQLEGQLTTTLHMTEDDTELAGRLMPVLEEKSGRILANGFPTGVEVCSSMMHGGPYPASTDVRATSVGTLAINRWLRPVSYQNIPSALLPIELRG